MASAASSRTVMIASGATGVRARFAEALQRAGHRTLEAGRTGDLLVSVDTDRLGVDLVLLDLGLAGGDRVSLVRRLGDRAVSLPTIIFSGSIVGADEVRELAAIGVSGYVNEHLDAEQILPSLGPHLFPERFDRRGSRRVVLAIPVSYRFDDTIAGALTLNISKGGLAISTMTPLAISTEARARFRLPGSEGEIGATSRVVWSDRRVGMGLQFEQVDAGDQTVIDDYVDRQHRGDPDGARRGSQS